MMETIRTAANNIVVKIIFAIIIVCFIFTGVGFLGFGGGNTSALDQQKYIAKVDGDGISRAEFEAQARTVTANAGGDNFFIKQLRRKVLSYQIDNYLAYKFSQKIGAAISNDQIKKFIKKQKEFFKNGKFDNQTYLNLLAENNFTPDSYAEIIRTALQQQQVVNAITNSSFILPIDSEISSLKNQTRSVYATSVNTSVSDIDESNITLDDEQKYYNEHLKDFFKNERVKVKYIVTSDDILRKTISVTEKEIKNEYDKNIKTYSYPPKKAYSVIFVTDKERADNIAKDLLSGRNFENIVNIVNQNNDISPYGKNGSLGWFADDDSLPQVFKDAQLKKVGDISLPINVDDGYLIVKLDGIQPKKFMDFDYVKYQIESKLTKQKIEQALESEENKIKTILSQTPKSIEEVANKVGLEVKISDWMSFNDKSSIVSHPEIRDVIFSEEMIVDDRVTNKISDLIPVDRKYGKYDFVVQTVDYRPEGIAPFDEVKDDIHKKLFTEMVQNQFKSSVDNILIQLDETGKAKNVKFAKKYTLNRNSTELDEKVVNMVFNLSPSPSGKTVYGVEFLDDKNADIVALTKVDTPEYKDISSELLPLFISNTHYYLAADIRSKAKIEIMPDSNL
ncbi:MAG: SurA N-terminal domain-containing protein [Gilliamella sp.]|uniref:SurA N-terminal domain-containing protein n=1 Tax=Gilliamella sp. TaxID=1891236 RepID=UPI0025EAF1B3|nr:SurA N-terminal domain-containing protein [Gilliamella sp.]MCO6544606.1 SurA N-terminal domain-containing protein [Gilliamella sp.]